MSRHRVPWWCWLAIASLLYVLTAVSVFSFRHPWMTQTERTLWFGRVLTFGTVTPEEVRAWEGR